MTAKSSFPISHRPAAKKLPPCGRSYEEVLRGELVDEIIDFLHAVVQYSACEVEEVLQAVPADGIMARKPVSVIVGFQITEELEHTWN